MKRKKCTGCGKRRVLSKFHNNTKGCKDGKQARCKECQAEATRNIPNRSHKITCQKYGITVDDYNRMFKEQKGCCSICGTHQIEFKRRLSIEHNHETGKVRSLACQPCNWMVGWSREDRDRLKLVDQYLEKHQ